MEDIINNLDELLAKAGQANRYQFIIVILFLIQFICSDFLNTGLPYLQNQPYIILNNTNESIKLNYTLCEQFFEIDSNKSIEDTFRNIDILISDNSSVILMFFLTGKPIIYCIFDVGFGTLFKSIMPGMYIARNWEEVEKYLKMLQNHEDPLKSVRNEIISNNFPQHHNVAEKIVNTIAEDYNRRNS